MDYFLIAEIGQNFGNQGFVWVKPVSDFPDRLLNLKEVYIDFWGYKKLFHIEEIKEQRNNFLFKFVHFNNVRDCSVLKGRRIFIDSKELNILPEKHFFIHDLIGLRVFIGHKKFGIIKDVLKLPANDVLVIANKDGSEKMLPFVLDFIEIIEPEKKKLSLKISKDFFEDENED